MKSMRNIFFLSGIFGSLITFWLIPSLYSAPPTTYQRVYEDTGAPQNPPVMDSTRKQKHKETKRRKKLYKTERISSRRKVKSLNPKMFSRSVQYFPEQEMIIVMDSANTEIIQEEVKTTLETETDSMKLASKKQAIYGDE
jgi:hypothetical protein